MNKINAFFHGWFCIRSCSAAVRCLNRIALSATAFAAERRERSNGGHTKRTAQLVLMLAEDAMKLGLYPGQLDAAYIRSLVKAAPLHDIGKITVPRVLLNKPDKLTPEELEIVKKHTSAGRRIIGQFICRTGDCGFLVMAADIAEFHHERWDGGGYPAGLSGEEIPLCARIMAVTDVFDALLSKRPYKEAYSFEDALSTVLGESGTHFDPRLCEALVSISERLREKIYIKKRQ